MSLVMQMTLLKNVYYLFTCYIYRHKPSVDMLIGTNHL